MSKLSYAMESGFLLGGCEISGLAKRVDSDAPDTDDPNGTQTAPLTKAGVVPGTPLYMSPEQAVGDELDTRSDIFSFGLILYEIVAGVRAFRGTGTVEILRGIVHAPHQPVREFRPETPTEMLALIDRCLEKSRDLRLPSIRDALDVLSRLASVRVEEPRSTTTAVVIPAVSEPRRHSLRWPWIAIAAVAAPVLAFLAYSAFQNRDATPVAMGKNATAQQLYASATELLRAYYREGNLDGAIEQLSTAIGKKSPYPQAEARLSLAYWRKNALSPDSVWVNLALAHAVQAVQGDPQLAIAHMAHGAALAASKEHGKAGEAYAKARALDPDNAELIWRIGDLETSRGNLRASEELYRAAVANAGDDWESCSKLGGLLYRQGRFTEALGAFESMIGRAKDHPRAYTGIAAVYHQLDRGGEAAAALQRSIEIAPDPLAYSNLGTLLYFQGRYKEAENALDQAVKRGANSFLRWGNLADAARMNPGGQNRAREHYIRAIQLAEEWLAVQPDDADARSSLALFLARNGQISAALPHLQKILGEANQAPAVLFKLAIVDELAGQRAPSLELLRRALSAGYPLREMRSEPDLVKLRTDPAYHQLVSRFAIKSQAK